MSPPQQDERQDCVGGDGFELALEFRPVLRPCAIMGVKRAVEHGFHQTLNGWFLGCLEQAIGDPRVDFPKDRQDLNGELLV